MTNQEIFDLKKPKVLKAARKNKFSNRSKKKDKEIDNLVYKLYGITEEERKVIEKDLDADRWSSHECDRYNHTIPNL